MEPAKRAYETIAAAAPRTLRLDELLHELGATTGEPSPSRPPGITVGELVDKASDGGFGFLIGILTLIAIPFFGLSTPFGLAIGLVGLQMVIGRHTPWLPRRARARRLAMTMLDRVAKLLERRMQWLSRSTKRRWTILLRPRIVGFCIVLLSLGLALPLPIPGSNLIFLFPLFIYAVGVLECDGLWIGVAHLLLLADIVLLFVFGRVVWAVLTGIVGWVF